MSDIGNKVYIDNKNANNEIDNYIAKVLRIEEENINAAKCLGRVTSKAVYAKVSDPVYNASAMDGIMVKSDMTKSACEIEPVILEKSEYKYANTGDPIDKEYDSVIMIEDVIRLENDRVKIIAPAYPWQYVRVVGESIVTGEMLLTSNHKIRPMDIGALIAGGVKEVPVYKMPQVGIIPTGHELVEDSDDLTVGKLMEYNSKIFSGLVSEYGGVPFIYPIVRDNMEDLTMAVKKAVSENDLVIVNAGSSAGNKDFTVKVLENLGNVISHGLAIKPGKPTILAQVENKPVIGIPGYPVSAYLMFEKCVKPLIARGNEGEYGSIEAVLTRRVVSSLKHKELVRISLGYVRNKWIATPLDRGAASIMTLVKADGIFEVPREVEGLEVGEPVSVRLLNNPESIKDTLVVIGSHDLILDIIADKLRLKSTHVGSLGGIMALQRGECHLAPIHLLDEVTGEYNKSFVKKYLGAGYSVIRGVGRIQGFMTQPEDDLEINSFKTLAQKDVTFANRQRGAGTRMLLDFHLKQEGISPDEIKGYQKEYNTHMAVAASVKSGTSRVGLGVYSAAAALGLKFTPICKEHYDFAIETKMLKNSRIKEFIAILQSEQFKKSLDELGGYSAEHIGEILED